ncbi:MAG TPA: OmcA/MtrC family decaheme c-type cytochrome [Anaeromyxobacter sp.]
MTTTWTWRRAAFGVAATAAVALALGACGKARKSGNNNPGTPVNEAVVNPYGFTIQVTGADLPADATAASSPPTVTFRVTDESGQPIQSLKDELGKAPSGSTPASGYPYTNAPRFTLARLDPDDTYHNVYLNAAGNQAVSITLPRDPTQFDARVTSNGNGSYTFKLDPLTANPTADERARTWTAGAWASRRPTQDTGADEAASSTLNFVPAGGTPVGKQIVSLAACDTCHAPAVRAHGVRLGTQLCLTCHTPQTSDPDTGNSVEFVELIHKIHYGGDRPLPAGQQPYTIIGFQNSVNVFNASWINDVRNCTLCHQGANADKHLSAPSQRACTTCHSIVKFDGSAPVTCTPDKKDTSDCNHPVQLAQGAVCSSCHTPQVLESQHVSIFTIAQQFQYEVKSVTVGTDRKPVVRFDVLDTATKQPRDLESDAAYTAPASSLNVQLGWPSKEYTNDGAGPTTPAPGQPRSMPIVRAGQLQTTVTKVAGQTGVYEVTSPVALPDGVTSATVFMDGHPVLRGENVPVTSAVQSFGASGGAGDARRQVVAVENCNKCHGVLSAHGRNRNGTTQVCVVCHNPKATDWQKRQGTTAQGTEQSIDFKVLIHGVHSADVRKDPMTVYGFNAANAAHGGAPGTPNEFPGQIPHGVANCVMCHAGTTYEPPLPAEALDTTIDTNNTPTDQTDDKTLGKTQAVCTSCHDQVHFTAADQGLPACGTLSPVNSAACFHSGGVQTADSACATCHGKGGPADVTTVHHVQ